MATVAFEHASKVYPDGTSAVTGLDLEIPDGGAGYGIVSHYGAVTEIGDRNTLVGNAKGISAFVDGRLVRHR